MIQIRRVYDDAAGQESVDGFRIYVDRLWPRGESKEKFHYALWDKDIAPSKELREWFHADPQGRWEEFSRRYMAELDANPEVPALLDEVTRHPLVTLLYSSKDTLHNNAVVLARYLEQKLAISGGGARRR